jgi:hypothetical protein
VVKDDIQALKREEFSRQTLDTKLFNSRSLKELKDWKTTIEAHFEIYPQHYIREETKVRSGLRMISLDWYRDWTGVRETLTAPVTWEVFTNALLRMVSDPQILREDAVIRHSAARQMENQDVRSFL